MHVDSRLSWDVHVGRLAERVSRSIFVLRQLSTSVSFRTIKVAYHSLVESSIRYGILLWGKCATAHRIFRLQRRAIRVLANLSYRACCRGAFKNLGLMTLPGLYMFECLLYAHKGAAKKQLRSEVHSYNTRANNELCIPYCRLRKSQSGPEYFCFKLYNMLPARMRSLVLKDFKLEIKKFLVDLEPYNVECFYNVFI